MTFSWLVFGLGCLGGLLAELLRWYKLRESTQFPEYIRSWFYWLLTVLMILAGGALAVVQEITPDKPLLAINVGIATPLILNALISGGSVPPTTPATTRGFFSAHSQSSSAPTAAEESQKS